MYRCCVFVCHIQASPLTFHYVIISRSSVLPSRTSDVVTVRQSGVTAGRKRRSLASLSTDSSPPTTGCGRASPDVEPEKSRTIGDDVMGSVDAVDRHEMLAVCSEKTVDRSDGGDCKVDGRTEAASARQQTSATAADNDDDDGCLSISTSVTVVISRRSAPSSSSATASDQAATDDGDTRAASAGNQVVVSATIPAKVAPSFPSQQPEVETATSCAAAATEKDERHGHDSSNDSTSPHVTADVSRSTSGSSRPKRKSLESVIKSLQPTPVVMSRQPEVARSRPEVLVRPMQAYAAARPNLHPVSTQAVRPIGHLDGQLSMPFSQPEVVDLRRPKRPAPTVSYVGPGASRRKPKSLSPIQAPPVVDDPHSSDKRRRFTSGLEAAWPVSARFGCYFPPTPALRGPAAVAAHYHACMAHTRPDLTRLPVYYGSLPQRTEPNGYDAPLELTTKRARDRK